MSPVSLSLPLATLSTWLTPPWLIGMGAAAGLLALAVVYGLAHLVSRKAATFFNDSLREGFLTPVLILAAILAVGAIAASPIVPVRDLWRSLLRLPTAGKLYVAVTVPPNVTDKRVDLEIRPSELKTLQIKSDQDLMLTLVEFGLIKEEKVAQKPVVHGEEFRWERAKAENNFFYGNESVLSVKNLSNQPAQVVFTGDIAEEFPEVAAVPQTAAALVGLVALFLIFKLLCPEDYGDWLGDHA